MSTIKTAISLDPMLFQKATHLAELWQVSRSRLIAIALEKLVRDYEDQRTTEALNALYADYTPVPEDEVVQQKMREHQRKLVEGTW